MTVTPAGHMGWVVACGFAAVLSGVSFADNQQYPPTFARDIAPIVFAHCASCHHASGAAPFPLVTFEDVSKRAKLIAKVTADRFMPPWLASSGDVTLNGTRGLTDAQIAMIQQWIDAGMLEGDVKDLPRPPQFSNDWTLGKPDVILTMSEPFEVPAVGIGVIRTFVFPLKLDDDRPLRAIDVRPSTTRAIHHAAFLLDTTGSAQMLDNAVPGPGYDGMGDIGFNQAGALGVWSRGSGPFVLPMETAAHVPANGDLVAEVHFSPTGKIEREKLEIGLYFADAPVRKVATAVTLGSHCIDLARGAKQYRVTDSFTLPVEAEVIGIGPHAHYLCRSMDISAVMTDRRQVTLLSIKDWDFNFLQPFMLKQPLCLQAGTKLEMEFVYDNSAANSRNPHDPPQHIKFGSGLGDEMAMAIVYVNPVKFNDLPELEKAHRAKQVQRMEEGKAFRAAQKELNN